MINSLRNSNRAREIVIQARVSGTALENGRKGRPVCEGLNRCYRETGHSLAGGVTLVTLRGVHGAWAIGAQLGRQQRGQSKELRFSSNCNRKTRRGMV